MYIHSIDDELSHVLEDRTKEVALKSYETGLRHYPQLTDPSDLMRDTIAVFGAQQGKTHRRILFSFRKLENVGD